MPVRNNLYFDTVPDDILRIVLRFLSARPQHRNWHPYISTHLVNTALDVGGALARAATQEFHNLGVDDGDEDGVPIDDVMNTPISRSLVHRLSLRRLVLELPAEEALPDLLRGCGSRLRELVLDTCNTVFTKSDGFAISTYCTNLSLLAIHTERVEGTLAPIWRSVGSTLTQLSIDCDYGAARYRILEIISVPDLVEHCVNLRSVRVLEFNDITADLLAALGSRIHVLNVGYDSAPSAAMWHEVYRACTNLKAVHLSTDSSEEVVDVLSIMPTKLVSLTVFNLHDLLPPKDRSFSVLSACSQLKEISLFLQFWDFIPDTQLHGLFESLKSVTTLMIILEAPVNSNKDIIDAIAGNLRNVESFTMSTYEPLKSDDVDVLVDLPHLRSVIFAPAFRNMPASEHPEKCVVEVVNKLKDCPTLVLLEFTDASLKNWSSIIAEAAAMYKRKDFDMFIGGVQYRTW